MRLGARQQDGATLREHLHAAAASGHVDDMLIVPPVPRECRAVWNAFTALSQHRRASMGAHALALSDVEAWCRLQGVRLTGWELDTITALDAASLRIAAEKRH